MSDFEEVQALLGSNIKDIDVTSNNINVIDFNGMNTVHSICIGRVAGAINEDEDLLELIRQKTANYIITRKIADLNSEIKKWKSLLPKGSK